MQNVSKKRACRSPEIPPPASASNARRRTGSGYSALSTLDRDVLSQALSYLSALAWALSLFYVGHLCFDSILDDSDISVSSSAVWFVDEGAYSYSAVSMLRYGQLYVPSDYSAVVHCPLLTVIQMGFFSMLGISLWSARAQGIVALFAAQILLFVFWAQRRAVFGGSVALLMVLFNYLLFAYTRSCLAEVFVGVFLAGLSFLLFSTRNPFVRGLGTGVVAFAAVLTKPSLVSLGIAAGLWLSVEAVFKKQARGTALKSLATYALVVLLASLATYHFWILRHKVEWDVFSYYAFDEQRMALDAVDAVRNILHYIPLLLRNPWSSFPLCISAGTIPLLINRLRRKQADSWTWIQIWGWCVFLSQFVMIGMHPYRPSRYFSAYCWAYVLIVAPFLQQLASNRIKRPNRAELAYALVPLAAGLLSLVITRVGSAPLTNGSFTIKLEGASPLPAQWFLPLFLSGVVLAFLTALQFRFNHVFTALFLIFVQVTTFTLSYALWQKTCRRTYYSFLRKMDATLPRDCIVMGMMSTAIALEHPCKAYWSPKALNGRNPAPDYLVLGRGISEVSEWYLQNGYLKDYFRAGFDKAFPPQKFDIMRNYYTKTSTTLIKLKKPSYLGMVLPRPVHPRVLLLRRVSGRRFVIVQAPEV